MTTNKKEETTGYAIPFPEMLEFQKAKQLPYPKAVLFVLSYKFFDRFFIQALRNMLVLYLTSQIGFSEKSASIIYHCHSAIIFSLGIVGAIISDSWLGNFRTILYTNIIGLIGMAIFVLYAATQLGLPYRAEWTVLALVVLSLANGCMKPCMIAFGAQQFELPEQKPQLERYFAKFYFILKLSAVVGCLVLPSLRSDIPSIGPADGYLLSFGVAFVIAAISVAIFLCGIPFYKKIKSDGNMLVLMVKCIGSAIAGKWRHVSVETSQDHWLEYASSRFNRKLVEDSKAFLNVLVMLTPIPMVWALNEQTASIFLLQATRLNGDVMGFYTIKPDQLQLLMQILVVLLLPLFELVLYPILAKLGIRTAFQKIGLGGFLSIVAYLTAGGLEMNIARHAISSVHMSWMLPQFILLASAEAIVGVTGMLFANMEAPTSLKTVIQATWLSTHAMGNVINIAVFSVGAFSNKALLFFTFAGLMFVDMLLFTLLAKRYKGNKV